MRKRICSNCGESNPSSNYTCSNCNSSLTRSKVVNVEMDTTKLSKGNSGTKTCPKCGVICKQTAFSCVRCGAYLVSGNTSSTRHSLSPQPTQTDNTLLFIVSFIVPLVGFIAGSILITNDDEYKKQDGKICLLLALSSAILVGIITFIITRSAINVI